MRLVNQIDYPDLFIQSAEEIICIAELDKKEIFILISKKYFDKPRFFSLIG